MLFAIGTKVRLKHTGDEGVITEMLSDGMLNVWIETQDMEIPVFEEDLIRAEDYQSKPVKAKIITKPPTKKAEKYIPPIADAETQYTILKSQGVQLAFDPQYDAAGLVNTYQVFLINDTYNEFIFSLQMNLPHRKGQTHHGKLDAISTFYVEDLLFDQLNDTPIFEFECWKLTTAGTGNKQHKSLKIKAQQFFKKVKTAPLLNRAVHLYLLLPNSEKKKAKPTEDLKSYTQKNTRPVRLQKFKNRKYNQHDVEEFANFSGEIDLHAENLNSHKGKMNNAEILRLQLAHFEQFMLKAIRLGVARVFIIHGIGKGKLKSHIASRLIQMPEVKTFKNEYHPKYGYGATEVIF
jgi:DNA-nicking Smr family endonuclease/uncharacterized protein YodC (DUF2158 family)